MTIEQSIVTNLNTALLGISIANSYSFDIDGNVFEWRDSELGENEKPAIIFRDHLNVTDENGEESRILNIEIICIAEGNASPAFVREMNQDVITAFYTLENKGVFDPIYVSGCYIDQIIKSIERDKKRVAGSKINCHVTYTAGIGMI